jgi:iron complex transport system permease protein
MRKRIFKWAGWTGILLILLLAVSLFSFLWGAVNIPLGEIAEIIAKGKTDARFAILFDIRLPRIILGFAIGGALSLAGVILQGMFRNPLVEPYTLGISGGAALGVTLNIALRLQHIFGLFSLPVFGFLGGICAIALIYILSVKQDILKIQNLLLCGVMLSFICSSLIMLIMALSRAEDLHGIVFWIMGSLEQPNWLLIKVALGAAVLGLVAAHIFCFDLNAFSLGEEEALHLGINVERSKRILFILTSLLTGFSVAIAGIIGFVGLIVPHFIRLLVGGDHRILLLSSFLSGAIFLIFCDTLARTIIAPIEFPVGVITGILGGSLFIYAFTRKLC